MNKKKYLHEIEARLINAPTATINFKFQSDDFLKELREQIDLRSTSFLNGLGEKIEVGKEKTEQEIKILETFFLNDSWEICSLETELEIVEIDFKTKT
jgi:hypothetical protein